jgi:hypothetical protein
MTNWKLGSINSPFQQNNICDRWGQQGFWMWKKCPHCGGLPQGGKGMTSTMEIFQHPDPSLDNSLKRVSVYAVNVVAALVPLVGRKEHFPEGLEDWEFDFDDTKNDYTEWKTMATKPFGTEGHRVACGGCGGVSSIEDWDVEPVDLWIPEEGEIIGFVHSDGTDYGDYWGCYIYESVPRKADDKLTWRRLKEHECNSERQSHNSSSDMLEEVVTKDIRVTNRRVMNVSPGSNLRHGAKVRDRKELTAELLRSF